MRDVLLGLDRFEVHHLRVVELLELALLIKDIGDTTTHTSGEVASCRAQDYHDTAGHVLAAVVAYPFHHRLRSRVADCEAFACKAPKVRLAARSTVEGH